jgi:hypothetical protein
MSFYKKGIHGSNWRSALPNQVVARVDNLIVGAEFWKTAENRFYEIGIRPSKMNERDITGIKPVDQIANMTLDFVHIGALLLGASAIHAALT